LQTNPLAELLREIACYHFNGSLRLAFEQYKTVIYFAGGKPIFAVSNARQHRFFETLLQAGKITTAQLTAIADFSNDFALRANLTQNNLLDQAESNALSTRQMREIIRDAVGWQAGEWVFNPLVRAKKDWRFEIAFDDLALDFARTISVEKARQKAKNTDEIFSAVSPIPAAVNLSPSEWFVHSRFENSTLTGGEIQSLSGLPEAETCRILYSLWLAGLVNRQIFFAAFSERYAAAVHASDLTLKRDALPIIITPAIKKTEPPPMAIAPIIKVEEPVAEVAPEKLISLEEYLIRIESSENFYEIFAHSHEAATADIKKSYFGLAKRFHPDLYRRDAAIELQTRVQNAFTKLAQAYDTLKDESSREVYDFKMRREIAEMIERRKSGATVEEVREDVEVQKQVDQAAESFERGFNFLMDRDYEAALPYLARAVFYGKGVARFHAYYGKVLAANAQQSHRAEAELQTAIKLDGENADYRIMLVEFFVDIGLRKRAEGELNRLLKLFPNNNEAIALLDSLKKK
ncbi:MAG: J domain-containing protein, partial [Acidobacteriota bacterium]|nr:J domain-containing protein [Acidobacteriota bacterium]